ncbi:unnamed protein product [Gordionus sp. m RMFG-2023]
MFRYLIFLCLQYVFIHDHGVFTQIEEPNLENMVHLNIQINHTSDDPFENYGKYEEKVIPNIDKFIKDAEHSNEISLSTTQSVASNKSIESLFSVPSTLYPHFPKNDAEILRGPYYVVDINPDSPKAGFIRTSNWYSPATRA